jgi:hypothetical protein
MSKDITIDIPIDITMGIPIDVLGYLLSFFTDKLNARLVSKVFRDSVDSSIKPKFGLTPIQTYYLLQEEIEGRIVCGNLSFLSFVRRLITYLNDRNVSPYDSTYGEINVKIWKVNEGNYNIFNGHYYRFRTNCPNMMRIIGPLTQNILHNYIDVFDVFDSKTVTLPEYFYVL